MPPRGAESACRHVASGDAVLDLRYPGGKGLAGLAEWICERLPGHVWYAEPFAGKGGVFRHKPPALRSWLIDSDPDVIEWWSRVRPPGTLVTAGDGIRWCELAAEWGPPDLLLYVDPPYLMETRSGKRLYKQELSRGDHVRLLQALKRCRCGVAISGYWNRLYAAELAGWQFYTRPCITRGGVLRDECLWVNAPPGGSFTVSYSDLGSDFRERERVARKVRRWTDRLAALPARERAAILRAVIAGGGLPRRG